MFPDLTTMASGTYRSTRATQERTGVLAKFCVPRRDLCLAFMPLVLVASTGTSKDEHSPFLNEKIGEFGPAAGQAAVFGTKNRGQLTFAFETSGDAGHQATAFQVDKSLTSAGTRPGRYALKFVFFSGTMRAYDIGGWSRSSPVGVIEVKPDEVIYIGDVTVKPQGMILQMTVNDRFEEFRAKLPPALQSKIKKRIIELPATLTFDTISR